MRTTLNLDQALLEEAGVYTGMKEKTALIHEGLRALIQREAATRLAALGGSSGTVDLDCGDDGPDWTITLTGAVAFTASDVPSGAVGLTVRITQDGSGGHTVDLSGLGTVLEAGELADGAGEVTELSLITRDTGATWSAFLVPVS